MAVLDIGNPAANLATSLGAGADIVKGIESIKASRQSRKESEQKIKESELATTKVGLELDEFRKDLDSGLFDQERFNKLKKASITATTLDTLGVVAKVDQKFAKGLAESGAMLKVQQLSNSMSEQQRESLITLNNQWKAGAISDSDAEKKALEINPELDFSGSPENDKKVLGVFAEYSILDSKQRKALQQIEAKMSDAVDTYETETMIDGVAYKQLRSKRDGSLVNQYLAVPKSPLVQVNTQDKAVNASNKEFLKRVRSEETRGRVSAAVAGKQNAKLAITSSQGDTLQGPLAKPIVELAEGAKTLAKVIGADALADKIDFTDEGILKGTTGRALLPFVKDYGGRGFTDADAERMMSGVASITNVQEANQVFGKIALAGNINTMEQAGFEEAVATRIEQGQIKSPGNVMTNYSDYQQDMPRFKATPDGFAVVDDGRNIWKYYTEGRPKVWVTNSGDIPHSQLQQMAKDKGLTFREVVSQMDKLNLISGTR